MHLVTRDLACCYAIQMIKLKQILLQKRLRLIFLLEQQKVAGQIYVLPILGPKSAAHLPALSNRSSSTASQGRIIA